MERKVELKFNSTVQELMLSCVATGEYFKNIYQSTQDELKLAVVKYYDDLIAEAESYQQPKAIKYYKQQKRYKLNKFKRDVEDFLVSLENSIEEYRSHSQQAKELVDAVVDNIDTVVSNTVEVSEDGIKINKLSLNKKK